MGIFIAIEGGDGSGKGTQTKLFAEYARTVLQKDVLALTFPRYGEKSALFVERYLNGRYGAANDVAADLGSLPYALDRYGAKEDIKKYLALKDGLILTDRFSASNFAHQGTKFDTAEARHAFYEEMMWLEWEHLGIPAPDINIVLLVDTEIAQKNVDKKDARSYTDKKRDIHEADLDHLQKAKQNYLELTQLYPEKFIGVNCMTEDGVMRSIEEIQDEIQKLVKRAIEAIL